MKTQNKALVLALGSAFAATLATAPVVHAAENPFAAKSLASGYMVADASDTGEKMKDGKCGTGKCGASMKKKMKEKAAVEAKAKEGNCSAEMKDKEGNCSAEMKAAADAKTKEGNCSGEKKSTEGKCSAKK